MSNQDTINKLHAGLMLAIGSQPIKLTKDGHLTKASVKQAMNAAIDYLSSESLVNQFEVKVEPSDNPLLGKLNVRIVPKASPSEITVSFKQP